MNLVIAETEALAMANRKSIIDINIAQKRNCFANTMLFFFAFQKRRFSNRNTLLFSGKLSLFVPSKLKSFIKITFLIKMR